MFESRSINSQTNLNTGTGDDVPESWGQIYQANHAMFAHVQNSSGVQDIEYDLFAERDAEVIKHIKATQDRGAIDTALNLDRYAKSDETSFKSLIPFATQGDLARQKTERDIQDVINANEGMFKTDDQIKKEATAKVRQIYDESTDILSRSDSLTAEIAGGFTGMMTDPMHQIGMLLGGKAALGKSLLSKMATMGAQEATAAIVTESFVQPEVYKTMERIGIDYSAKEALAAIGLAGAGGFVFGGALQGMGSVITRNFSDADDVLKAAKSRKQEMWRDVETGRLKKTDDVMAAQWEAESLELTLAGIVQVTGKKAPATEVVARLFELKAAEIQLGRVIDGSYNKFDSHLALWHQSKVDDATFEFTTATYERITKQLNMLKDWQKSLKDDSRFELSTDSLNRLQDQLSNVENNPREYFKWQGKTPENTRQSKKNDKTGYAEPNPKKLNKEQKAEREDLLRGLKGALERHDVAVAAKKALANYDRNIIPESVRKAVDDETGLALGDELPTQADIDTPLSVPVRKTTPVPIAPAGRTYAPENLNPTFNEARAARGAVQKSNPLAESINEIPPVISKVEAAARLARANTLAITPEIDTPLSPTATARIADDILSEKILEEDKILFAVADDVDPDADIPMGIKVVDGEESIELVKAGEVLAVAAKRQDGLEKIEMCMRGTKG